MNALRGAIVVVLALVIGVVVLARGLDEPDSDDPVQTTDTTAATTTSATEAAVAEPAPAAQEPPPPPPEAAPPPPPPADDIPPEMPDDMVVESTPAPAASPTHSRNEVRVLVANGTSVCGAAGRLATSLSAQGFNVMPATNADSAADASAIYYVEQYGADAGVVATMLQVDLSRVLPMPASPLTAPGDAHVVIHIGADDLAQPNC